MRRLLLRLFNVVRPDLAEAELAREMASHVTLIEEEFRRRGMTAEEARCAARKAIGGIEHAKDRQRDARSFPWLDDARWDARYAWRSLSGNPGFAAIAVLTIALGIGANTAIFSVVNAVVLHPLPYREPERLVVLYENVPAAESPNRQPRRLGGILAGEFLELRSRSRTLSHVVGTGFSIVTLIGASDAAGLTGATVSAGTFQMLGVQPILGRWLLSEEEAPGRDKVIVLSYSMWRRLFRGDRDVLGRAVSFTGNSTFIGGAALGVGYTVVGVMPEGFHFPDDQAQFWIPAAIAAPPGARPRRVSMVARLADGHSTEAAVAEVAAILAEVRAPRGPGESRQRFELVRVQDEISKPVKPALWVLTAAVGFVLLIACANVANLLLARTSSRHREIAVRLALGAGRSRLVRQVLTESAMLGLIGGVVGVGLAFGGVRLFRSMAASLPRMDLGTDAPFPRLDAIAIDVTVLAYAAALSLVTGLLFGLLPAIVHSRTHHVPGRHETIGRAGLRGDRTVQGFLVVAEIAIAMLLLVGGGLLLLSFIKLTRVETGYDATDVLTFQVAVRGDLYPAQRLQTYADDLVARLRAVPGVDGAAYTRQLPLVQLQETFVLRTTPEPPPRGTPPVPGTGADARFVGSGYLDVMGIQVVAGRSLGGSNARRAELVINQTLARRDFPGNPVGQIVYMGRDARPYEIVGVVADVRQHGLNREAGAQFFTDITNYSDQIVINGRSNRFPVGPYYVVRTRARAATAVLADILAIARQLDPQSALDNVAPMEQLVSNSMIRPRLYAVLLGIFSGLAVALATLGIFGVMAYAVAQRTREIGIRMALGAQPRAVLGLVLKRGLVLTAIGIAIGTVGATVLTRYLEGMLFNVTPLDPATFIAVALFFAAVALLASYLPARRAVRVDPLIALRHE